MSARTRPPVCGCRTASSLPEWGKVRPGDSQEILNLAWEDQPRPQRVLLESIGCTQRRALSRPLGAEIAMLYSSAGHRSLPGAARRRLDAAIGVWVPELRVVLLNDSHPAFDDLDHSSYEAAIARVAWHEWGHALSLHRASDADVSDGPLLVATAPVGIAQVVRAGDYRDHDLVHELIAEIYSLLMARRRRGARGKPEWLNDRLWEVVTRTTDWAG